MSFKLYGDKPMPWNKAFKARAREFDIADFYARGLYAEICRVTKSDGTVKVGSDLKSGLGKLILLTKSQRQSVVSWLEELVSIGMIRVEGDTIVVVELAGSQHRLGTDLAQTGHRLGTDLAQTGHRLGTANEANPLKSLKTPTRHIEIEIDKEEDKEEDKEIKNVELQSEVETSAPSLPKNISGGETESDLDFVAGRDDVSPTPHSAAPPSQSVSPSAIAGSPLDLESISESETIRGSVEKEKSILESPRKIRSKKEKSSGSPDANEVWSYWKKITGSEKAQLSDARAKRIEWAIKTYGVDECKACIDGYGSSDFHRGVNDRQTPYLDLTLWFRDETKFEAGLALANTPAAKAARRQRVPQTPKDFAAAAREAGKFFWDNRVKLGPDADAHNNDWCEFVYLFCRHALENPARRIKGNAVAEDTLWAAYNAELDAWESDPNALNIHPYSLCKRIENSVSEWDRERLYMLRELAQQREVHA